jgi:hypothetical protein
LLMCGAGKPPLHDVMQHLVSTAKLHVASSGYVNG